MHCYVHQQTVRYFEYLAQKRYKRAEESVTVLLCLPLLVAVDHLRAGLLHVLHGGGASVRHAGAGGHGPYTQPG